MAGKPPDPRSSMGEKDTWLEPEELCYPNGGWKRRCRAINVETGELETVWCGIPDTAFSIPCRTGGWVGNDDGVFQYHPPKKEE